MIHRLVASCPNGHNQHLDYKGIDRSFVDGQAGLLDGTSPFYVHSPIGTDSVIGKCGICKAQIKCSVLDIDEHQLRADLVSSLAQSFNVSYNASFPTSQNIDALLSNAFAQSRNMAMNGGIYSVASTELLLTQAVILGSTLSGKVGNLDSQSNAPADASTTAAPAGKQ